MKHLDHEQALQYINLKLAFLGSPVLQNKSNTGLLEIAQPLIHRNIEQSRAACLSAADSRIQNFLDNYLKDISGALPRLPARTFTLDYPGLARTLSLPPDADHFSSSILDSYRIRQGVLHNPKNDRRTTQGVFHIAEGGLGIPDDKIAVPRVVFKNILAEALQPPAELMRLPFTAAQAEQAGLFVSLLIRPVVSPAVEGVLPQKTMEIRFFAPGSLVCNLDFIEEIFGNAGDPSLAANDAALDPEHWTGHTGCVILAPHLIKLKKRDLGLPQFELANERQRRDGMCWKKENELYNNGQAFKITCRDERGVMVTIIADNYFGYCKKEVKTQISFSANLLGLSEEEHSGGAVTFASYDLGEEFSLAELASPQTASLGEAMALLAGQVHLHPEGYAVDRQYPDMIYIPEDAKFDLPAQSITWSKDGKEQKLPLLARHKYIYPNGYKIFIKKQTGGHPWHLIGTTAEGVLCHKPCTVSGGGKSEISKSITDAMLQGPVFVADFQKDMDAVAEILKLNFGQRFKDPGKRGRPSRPVLSPKRSLGSVIKLFTVSNDYTDEYNAWLQSVPHHIKEIIFTVKRFYRQEWGEDWRRHFSVDMINGHPGNELKFNSHKLVANYLRVGREKDGSWRTFRVRQDFAAAQKLQVADDITASIVVGREHLKGLNEGFRHPSVKLIENCENRLFQRPDDAVYRGYDKQTERDLAGEDNFISNFEPLSPEKARRLVDDAIGFDLFSPPMKKLIAEFAKEGRPSYVVSSAHPRIVDGKPSKNPRYLQKRPDLAHPEKKYLSQTGVRLCRKIPNHQPLYLPVNAVLPGRRNNPPDRKINLPALAVYNPVHYQELPELFMDFICSLTGKSPSTTGFGSEGALTKGPFNALWPVVDLNNALVSFIITGYDGFSSAAGYIGPNYRIDHDISLLIPEIWCRMTPQEQNPRYLIEQGYLEKLNDFEFCGKEVPASLLGYRITLKFVQSFMGRIFTNTNAVFPEDMLAPEEQSLEIFVEGLENIVTAQKEVAENYFRDGSIEAACPPLKALLHIMARGHYKGMDRNHPDFRRLFTRKALLESSWYRVRLATKQIRDIRLWEKHLEYLERYLDKENLEPLLQMTLADRLVRAREEYDKVRSPEYLGLLEGTLGADPFTGQIAESGQSLLRK